MASTAAVKKNRRKAIRWLLLFILVSLILIYISQFSTNKIRRLDAHRREIKVELIRYQKIGREVREIRKKLSTVKIKYNILENLDKDRDSVVRKLSDVYNTKPIDKVKLEKLTFEQSRIMINGRAETSEVLTGYREALESLAWVGDVQLATNSRTAADGTKWIVFQMGLQEKQPKQHTTTPKKRKASP